MAQTISRTLLSPGSASAGEKAFVVLVLLLSTGAFLNLAISKGTTIDQVNGSDTMQVIWTIVYLTTVVLLYRKCKGWATALTRERWFALLLVFALTSIVWSDAPEITLRRGIALLGTCLFGVYLANRYNLREQLNLVAWACGIAIVCSLLFGLFGIGTSAGGLVGWVGIYNHKQVLGQVMVLSSVVFLFIAKSSQENRFSAWIAAALSIILVLLSESKTALVVLLILFCLFPVCRLLRRNARRAIAGGMVAMAVGSAALFWVATHFEAVTDALGRDVTLTGRLKLWVVSVVMALRHPWIGYGYSAFWLGADGQSTVMWHLMGWHPSHSHNGFLQIWLDLGLIGLAIFLIGFCVVTVRAIGLSRRSHSVESFWPLMFLAFLFLYNFTESSFLTRNSIFWILYTAFILVVSPGFRPMQNSLRTAT